MPALELGAKARLERQMERIARYRMGKYSGNRIDDAEEIRKNIENLERELEAQRDSAEKARGEAMRFGRRVNLVHLPSKHFVGVRARVSGCQLEIDEYIPLE